MSLANMHTDQDAKEYSTTIKTPKYSQLKLGGGKPGDGYGIFDESHNKSKTAAGPNDLSPISPVSNRLFNFSGTGVGHSGNLHGGNGIPTPGPLYFVSSSNISKKNRKPNGAETDTITEKEQHSISMVNPFSIHPRSSRENNSPFTKSPVSKHEEDFEIKPLQWQREGAANQAQDDNREQKEKMDQAQYDMMMYQMQQQHIYENQKHIQTQQMMVRTCPVHGEGNQYRQNYEMMQAQAHAYAYSCFLYFQKMASNSKTQDEKAYFSQQASIAGCMIHGPHGVSPVGMPPASSMYGGFRPHGFNSFMGPGAATNSHSNKQRREKSTTDKTSKNIINTEHPSTLDASNFA